MVWGPPSCNLFFKRESSSFLFRSLTTGIACGMFSGFGRDFPNRCLAEWRRLGEDHAKSAQGARSLSNFEQSGMSNPMFSIDHVYVLIPAFEPTK